MELNGFNTVLTPSDFCTDLSVHGLCDRNAGVLNAGAKKPLYGVYRMSCARDSAAGSHYEACQQVGEN